ncbi:hypothetical protein K440DRAFT_326940 [Wilcoxina mikolae CBS 423.85]|nr:hypothetical protein K440DRAFT_326940 [Wilcoxina mikolae CBS 423.85]
MLGLLCSGCGLGWAGWLTARTTTNLQFDYGEFKGRYGANDDNEGFNLSLDFWGPCAEQPTASHYTQKARLLNGHCSHCYSSCSPHIHAPQSFRDVDY